MSNFGSGIFLNEDWDFEVDVTGDLKSTSGPDELQKDVSFNVARNVEIGKRLDSSTQKKIQVTVRDVLVNEYRIESIRELDVRRVDSSNKFEIIAEVDTITDETPELVFEVSA